MLEIVECGLDWLTATHPNNGREQAVLAHARRILKREEERGNETEPWAWMGYLGSSCGAARMGDRGDSCICQVRNHLADSEGLGLLRLGMKPSRVDLQVTVRASPRVSDWAWSTYQATAHRQGSRGRPLTKRITMDKTGGQTYYAGVRTGAWYFRLYDKAVESGEDRYRDCWRFELECKGRLAPAAMVAYQSADDRRAWVASTVRGAAERAGCTGLWDSGSVQLPGVSRDQRTDDSAAFGWLARQVRPTIDRLRQRYESQRVLEELGFRYMARPITED